MRVKWVEVDGFYVRKYKSHWWQRWKVTMYKGKVAIYECVSGYMYQRR